MLADMSWNPALYLAFSDHRLRPALDLLSRVGGAGARRIYDLGCGPGTVTRLLGQRFPEAKIVGVDGSAEMLLRARAECPTATFEQADLTTFTPGPDGEVDVDIIFSNAALHYLDEHERLFPRLLGALRPGGTLAVQMPRNHAAPSHTAIAETIESGPFDDRLKARLRSVRTTRPVHAAATYFELLRAHTAGPPPECWETEYLHVLPPPPPEKAELHPVALWTSSTVLRPYLDLLDELGEAPRREFLAEYSARLAAAYPRRDDNTTLFPFRRVFFVVAEYAPRPQGAKAAGPAKSPIERPA